MHWTRAIILCIEGLVEIVERYGDRVIRSVRETWPMPAVIRWVKHVKRHKGVVRFSREGIFLRDEGRCVYCDRAVLLTRFTLDHVLPKSRGGTACWENIVTACVACNRYKRDRTPEEAGMHLRSQPTAPKRGVAYYALLRKRKRVPKEWRSWLLYAEWAAEFYAARHEVCTSGHREAT